MSIEDTLKSVVRDAIREAMPKAPAQTETRLMDRAAVAKYLGGVSLGTVDNLRALGKLPPPVDLLAGKPMWDIRDVDAAIDRLKQAAA